MKRILSYAVLILVLSHSHLLIVIGVIAHRLWIMGLSHVRIKVFLILYIHISRSTSIHSKVIILIHFKFLILSEFVYNIYFYNILRANNHKNVCKNLIVRKSFIKLNIVYLIICKTFSL